MHFAPLQCAFRLDVRMCVTHTMQMNDKPNVRVIRERLGWTQEQMAAHLGLDRSSVSRMENGQVPKGPTRRLLENLAASAPSQGIADGAAA